VQKVIKACRQWQQLSASTTSEVTVSRDITEEWTSDMVDNLDNSLLALMRNKVLIQFNAE